MGVMDYVTTQMSDSPTTQRTDEGWTLTARYMIENSTGPGEILYTADSLFSPVPGFQEEHPTFPGLYNQTVSLEWAPGSPDEAPSSVVFMTVTYTQRPFNLNPRLETWSWNIASRQVHVTSVWDESYTLHAPAADDYGTAIGVKGDTVEGVDVQRKTMSLTVVKLWDWVSAAGRETIEALTSSVNLYGWMGYYPGEVMFDGAQFTQTNTSQMKIIYHFTVSRAVGVREIPLTNGDTAILDAPPFDYVWMVHGKTQVTGADSKDITQRTIDSVHLAQVYDYADFGFLELWGPSGG